jgi:hypothetical protein
MISRFCLWLALFVSPLKSKSGLEAENAALRHQLIILRRKVHAPKVVVDDDDSVDIEALFADSIIDERTTKLTIDMQGEEIQLELWSLKCNKTVGFDGGGYNFAMDSLQISTIGTLSAYMPPSVAGTVCSLVGESRPVLSSI